jgi:hypothetical protein
LYLLKGKFLENKGEEKTETVSCYMQAIEIARKQNAKSFELQGAIALVKFGEGRDLLREAYQWFEKGLDSELLVEARALIDEDK